MHLIFRNSLQKILSHRDFGLKLFTIKLCTGAQFPSRVANRKITEAKFNYYLKSILILYKHKGLMCCVWKMRLYHISGDKVVAKKAKIQCSKGCYI